MRHNLPTVLLLFQAFLWIPTSGINGQNLLRLDSIYFDRGIDGTPDFTPERRVVVQDHDAQGRPLTTVTYRKSPAGNWFFWHRRQYAYQAGELSQLRIQYWNPASQIWEDAVERNFDYLPNGEPASRLIRRAPSPGAPLENERQFNYAYNNNDQLQQLLVQTWNGASWENLARQLWAYQPDGQVQAQVTQNWDGSAWQPSRRRIWLYEANANALKSVTSEVWNAATQSWQEVERKLYLNDGQFSWNGIVHQTWSDSAQGWENVSRQLINDNGSAFEGKEHQVWKNNSWEPYYRESAGIAGDTLEVRIDTWESLQNDWTLAARSQTLFDENRLVLNQGWQFWDQDQSVWLNNSTTERTRRFWGQVATRLSEVTQYPVACTTTNPYIPGSPVYCPDLESHKLYRITLCDLSGRRVMERQFAGSDALSIDTSFPPGMYLMWIRNQESQLVHLQKLIIP